MAGINFTSKSVPMPFVANSGGLNSTASPIGVNDNEASALQNIDFDRFGAFRKRNGFTLLNTVAANSGATNTSLHYFENKTSDKLLGTFGDQLMKMDALDGTWDDITPLSQAFEGSGLDDATFAGTYVGASSPVYRVVIDAAGAPDTFEWFKNGVSQAAGVAITGAAQTLDSGMTITFLATTGHTLADYWEGFPPLSITAGNTNLFQWITFNNGAYGTNGVDYPILVNADYNASNFTVPTDLSKAKYLESFENYAFMANCTVNDILRPTRLYWSALDDATTWDAADFNEVGLDDGEDIIGIKKLGDRLVIYKERSIYIALFTGDADIPFVFKKSPSEVGCVSGYSIQEAKNGHFFLSVDGIYFFDGFNSIKISDRITTTIQDLNSNRMRFAVSCYQKTKNKYWLSVSSASGSHDTVITYDAFNNAFSVYSGIDANSIILMNFSGDERIYFGNYTGFCCRADVSNEASDKDDTNVNIAIEGYYKTKWFDFGDVVLQKGVSQSVFYYDYSNTTLTVSYSYDLDDGNDRSQNFSISQGSAAWDSAVWDVDTWAKSGGSFQRIDHAGRGRLMRVIFYNNSIGEPFKVNAFGILAHLETEAG